LRRDTNICVGSCISCPTNSRNKIRVASNRFVSNLNGRFSADSAQIGFRAILFASAIQFPGWWLRPVIPMSSMSRFAVDTSRAAACWLLLGVTSLAFGQQYPFLPVPGAPKNVRALFQDSRGRLWIGGDQLACYDGTRLFFLSDYGFPAASTYSLTEDASGAIWIGAETGVYRFSGGQVDEITKGVAVSVFAATPDIVTAAIGPPGQGLPLNASLVRMQRTGDRWQTETVMSLNSPGPLTLDHGGRLLYLVDGGWNELRTEDIVHWRPESKLPIDHHPLGNPDAPGAGPRRILRDRSGCLWIGSDGQNQYQCGAEPWRIAPFTSVRAGLTETADGSMLLAGYNILAVGRPGSFRVARAANGLPELVAAIEGKDGTIWLGGAQGLYRFASPFRMEYWTARDGVDSPWSLQRIGNDVYAGLDRSIGVLSKNRQNWQNLPPFPSVGQVMNLLPYGDGTLMAAINAGVAILVRPDGTVVARIPGPADNGYGLRLAMTANREIWLGGLTLGQLTRNGSVLKVENHHLETQPAGNVLDVQYEEHTRKLWACYVGGLAVRSEDGSWREISTRDGLLVNPCWSLAALPNGDVWYGYYNTPAIALIHPTADGHFTVRQYRAGEQLQDPESLVFDLDKRGWLWRGGNRGLSVANAVDAEAGRWIYFNPADGLSGEGVNSGSFFADSDGSVWMGIDMTIFHYSPPDDLLTPRFTPQIFLSSFSWDSAAPKLAEAIAGLPSGAKAVAHIGTLQFDRRSALRLRYRVLPEQTWRESGSLDLPLGTLSSGAHTLEVQGRVYTGPWSSTLRSPVSVLVPTWRSWPLLLVYSLTGFLAIGGGALWHRNRQAEEAELLPDLAAWRMGALLPEVQELEGTRLDERFEVGQLLARGGFANVMEGYDHLQKQRCAIKVFRGEVKDKDWIQRGFEQEVAALQKMRHPNIVTIYAYGNIPSGAPYLVMEFVEGRNLREVLEDGALTPMRTARLLQQLASALDSIHSQEIFHRDVKPENIIIRNEGSPEEESVLIDFSIAIVKDANETLYGLSRAAGSFDYMAPEQAVGYAEPSSDIYSLAKLVIEMLTGQRLSHLLPAASIDLPVRARELLRTLPGIAFSEESIIMFASALEFDPVRRPHAAGVFARPLVSDLSQTDPSGKDDPASRALD
jgi:tRNA A-37 threonylcarbamoyl transferase component Bud32